MTLNVLLIFLILAGAGLIVYLVLFRKTGADLESFDEEDSDQYALENIKYKMIDEFDRILQTNYAELNLNRLETLKNERNQSKLRKSLKECAQGNLSSKNYVKDYIQDLLRSTFNVTEETIDQIIPFHDPDLMTAQDKFEVLLYVYKLKYKYKGLDEMFKKNGFDKEYGSGTATYYEMTKQDVELAYSRHAKAIAQLDHYDYLSIVTQRVYQITYGLGTIDEIRDMVIDGINCGTSGIPSTFYIPDGDTRFGAAPGELPRASYNAIWLMFHGRMIHLSALGFESERELQRVSKLVYRYDSPGTLDKATGYMVNFMQDGSRVTVARPDMAESWMFYIRKFDSASKMPIKEMYPYKNNDKLVELLRWIVSGCRNIAVTGAQATGKSTLLGSLIQFMPASQAIRVQEMAFELHLRKIYPTRNIATFRETNTVSAQEGIDFIKKTDGALGVFGEIAQAAVAALAIQMGQVGMTQVIFTHHAKTAKDLVEAFRDNMIEAAGFNNERIVEKTVAHVLNFDVHLARDIQGHRFIQRITEIVPRVAEDYPEDVDEAAKQYYYRQTDRQLFDAVDILRLDDWNYHYVNQITEESQDAIESFLTDSEKQEFRQFIKRLGAEIGGM